MMTRRDQHDRALAFHSWAKTLSELIYWARQPDAETCSGDGWREHFKTNIRVSGDRARDLAPDDATRNQVTRARSLACDVVRMLNTCPDLNSIPCRQWPATERGIVEELAKLQTTFAALGDGERRADDVTATMKPEAAKTEAPAKPETRAKTEGAVSQGVFAYNGKRAKDIPPAPWRLLEFMEDKTEADIDEAYEHAIDEHDAEAASSAAIKGLLNKANNALLTVNYPKTLSKPRGVHKIVWL